MPPEARGASALNRKVVMKVWSHATGLCEPGQVRKEAAISIALVCRGAAELELTLGDALVSYGRRRLHGVFGENELQSLSKKIPPLKIL